MSYGQSGAESTSPAPIAGTRSPSHRKGLRLASHQLVAMVSMLLSTVASAGPAEQEQVPTSQSMKSMLHTIIVIGEGKASAKPDVAVAVVGVETVGKTLGEVNDRNSAKMDALIKSLKSNGVADKDIQTTNYSITPERKYSRETGPGDVTSFRISNQVRVKFRDLKKVGALLDRVVKEGANTIQSIYFEADDPTPIRARASAAAIAAARVNAEEMAKAAR